MDMVVYPLAVILPATVRRIDSKPRSRRAMALDLVSAWRDAGTSLVFGVPGGGSNLDVVGTVHECGMRFVLTHTETAAAVMAGVVGELTGAPGACVVTRGPGMASAVNGVAQALLDRQPMVLVADCVGASDRDRVSHQRIDQLALMAPVTLASVAFGGESDELPRAIVARVLGPRPGPVHVDVLALVRKRRKDGSHDLERRIRDRAYQLWLNEGQPEGRAEVHWDMATELVAIEENQLHTLKPVENYSGISASGKPVEPCSRLKMSENFQHSRIREKSRRIPLHHRRLSRAKYEQRNTMRKNPVNDKNIGQRQQVCRT